MLRKYLAGATGDKASVKNNLIEFGRKFYYYCIVVYHCSTGTGTCLCYVTARQRL